MLLAVKFWATAHLLANGTLADVLLFGGFLVWAVADRISVKRRSAGRGARRAGGAGAPGERRDRGRRRPGRLRGLPALGPSLDHRRVAARLIAQRVRHAVSLAVSPWAGPSHRGRAVSPERHGLRRAAQPPPLARRARRRGRRSRRTAARRAMSCSPSSRATRSSLPGGAVADRRRTRTPLEVGAALGIVIGRTACAVAEARCARPRRRLPRRRRLHACRARRTSGRRSARWRATRRACSARTSCRAAAVGDPDALTIAHLRRRRARRSRRARPSTSARRRA